MNICHVLLFCTPLVFGGIVSTGLMNRFGKGDEKTPMADHIAQGLDGIEHVKNRLKMVAPSTREAGENSRNFSKVESRAVQSVGLDTDRVKLMFISFFYLRSMGPLGHA